MELPRRKRIRLKGHDYSAPGAYFITICTHERRHLLSDIVGAIHESPENQLTEIGMIAEQVIQTLPERFDISIPKYVIMPNHIHMIVKIRYDKERAIRESPLQNHRSIISNAIGFFKMNVSKAGHSTHNTKIWQRLFHDHIIRNEEEYQKICNYIDTNVAHWEKDCFF